MGQSDKRRSFGAVHHRGVSRAKCVRTDLVRLVSVRGVWAVVGLQAKEISELKERLRPKLRIFWDDEGCMKHMTRTPTPFVFFRVGVESMGADHVSDCKGFLTRIEKDGTTRWSGNNVLLTF